MSEWEVELVQDMQMVFVHIAAREERESILRRKCGNSSLTFPIDKISYSTYAMDAL
jgi:hypothetical protein